MPSELMASLHVFLKRLERFGYMTRIITTAKLMNGAYRVLCS